MLFSVIYIALVSLTASVFAIPHDHHHHHHHHRRAPAQVVTSCTAPNTAALTFDDGPYYYIYDISRTLRAHNAIGTFFLNGNNYGCIYTEDNAKRVKYVVDNGHQVGSHTWAHKNLTTLTWDQIHDEMWRVEEALMKIVGKYPAFTRPPFGEYNDLVREAAGVRGQILVNWDFDSGDSMGASVAQQKANLDQLLATHPNNVLSLQHETLATTMTDVLPYYIQKLQQADYRLVSLAECTGKPAYLWTTTPQARDSTWHC